MSAPPCPLQEGGIKNTNKPRGAAGPGPHRDLHRARKKGKISMYVYIALKGT